MGNAFILSSPKQPRNSTISSDGWRDEICHLAKALGKMLKVTGLLGVEENGGREEG